MGIDYRSAMLGCGYAPASQEAQQRAAYYASLHGAQRRTPKALPPPAGILPAPDDAAILGALSEMG